MNLKALHDEVAEILDKDVSFCLSLDVWRYAGEDDDPRIRVTVSIWDGHRHFEGFTPQTALDQLKAAYNIGAGPIPVEIVVPVPTLTPVDC